MSGRSLFMLALWAALAALLIGGLSGEDQSVSLRIWLAAFGVWFAGALLLRSSQMLRLVPARFRLLVAARRKPKPDQAGYLRAFGSLESLLLRSRDNHRTHGQQLRPRLTEVAEHFLLVNHGIDRQRDPEAATARLGDVAWLIDDAHPEIAPTLEQIEELLDVLRVPALPSESPLELPTA